MQLDESTDGFAATKGSLCLLAALFGRIARNHYGLMLAFDYLGSLETLECTRKASYTLYPNSVIGLNNELRSN